MLTTAEIEGKLRQLLWAEAGNTAINLMNIQTSHQDQKSPYELFTKKEMPPKYASNLKRFAKLESSSDRKRLKVKSLTEDKKP